ncbi:MAG: glucose 1-dehydrogenase [Chloroflexi bacterium]|nr:glucose 1-dehydrogenase [Chloroflexota bacterium]
MSESSYMQLENKVAIVTGASRGIGKAIAIAFAREGARVVLASRKQELLDDVVSEIEADGGTARAVATHTGDPMQCKALVDAAIGAFGKVDILVNNAATNPHFGPLLTAEASHWQKILDVNLMGYFWLSKFVTEGSMQASGGGKIINMASTAGINPGPLMGVYSVSKAAVIMLTKALAQELGGFNIQVNAIAPGIVKTRFAQALWGSPDILKRYTDRTPLERIAAPEDIIGPVVYLASDQSGYHTGDVLLLDGGNSIMGF